MDEVAIRRFAAMWKIRRFEEEMLALYQAGQIPGQLHPAIGQEAVAVAVGEALDERDLLFSTHRNHGHLLGRGLAPEPMAAEILGKSTGYNRGKGGSMHIAAPHLGVPTTSALVAGNAPIAVGAAWALKQRGQGGIAVAFFGDGTLEEGAIFEAFRLAALWAVPLLFVCENNGWQRGTDPPGLGRFAEPFGIPGVRLDGDRPAPLFTSVASVVGTVRQRQGPHFLEVRTEPWPGQGDLKHAPTATPLAEALRGESDQLEVGGWRDPLLQYGTELVRQGRASALDLLEVADAVSREVSAAVARAQAAATPDPSEALVHVLVEG